MKKWITIILFGLMLTISVYAQSTSTITYFDTVRERYLTVRATHIGWQHIYITFLDSGSSSARAIRYISTKLTDEEATRLGVSTEWSESDSFYTSPMPYETSRRYLNIMRDGFLNNFNKSSRAGFSTNNSFLQILSVPRGRSVPVWFDQDGTLNVFFEIYIIVE